MLLLSDAKQMDFVVLGLRGGRIRLSADLGKGPASVLSTVVNDGHWHSVSQSPEGCLQGPEPDQDLNPALSVCLSGECRGEPEVRVPDGGRLPSHHRLNQREPHGRGQDAVPRRVTCRCEQPEDRCKSPHDITHILHQSRASRVEICPETCKRQPSSSVGDK